MAKIQAVNTMQNERRGTCGKKKLPYVPSKDEVLKILSYTDDIRLGFCVFAGCFQGLRIGEIVRMKWCDVDLVNGELKVVDGKNTRRYKSNYGKDRIVPINEMFLPLWKVWRLMNPEQQHVIPGDDRFGVRTTDQNLIRQMQKRLADVLEKADLLDVDYYQQDGKPRYKFHTHSFRHVCGTNLRRAGMKIEDVRDFLGHDDVEKPDLIFKLKSGEEIAIEVETGMNFKKHKKRLIEKFKKIKEEYDDRVVIVLTNSDHKRKYKTLLQREIPVLVRTDIPQLMQTIFNKK